MSQQAQPRIAIIGGGITGLSAAHRLREIQPDWSIELFEGSDRLGGVLQTTRTPEGYLLEHSADNFITNIPFGLDLCRKLGLEQELLTTNQTLRKAYVLRKGKLHPVPDGFLLMAPGRIWPVISTPILSWPGKLRLACEMFVSRRQSTEDEDLRSFVTRRLGKEAFDRLVQPLIGGIYTADPDKLSVQATLAQFVEMEQKHGSLVRGMRRKRQSKQESGARYSMFVAPKGGMAQLIDRLKNSLDESAIHLGVPIRQVRQSEGSWAVDAGEESHRFDGVIVAVGAPQAAELLDEQKQLSGLLRQIHYAGCSVAILTVDESQLQRPISGFGVVIPEVENRRILAVSFSSYKFPGRAPAGKVVIRVFIGGAMHPELAELSDDELKTIVIEEMTELFGLVGQPEMFLVTRWTGKMPQYHVGHVQRVEELERRVAEIPGLELAGNAYLGVGIPQCIHSGEQAACRIINQLTRD